MTNPPATDRVLARLKIERTRVPPHAEWHDMSIDAFDTVRMMLMLEGKASRARTLVHLAARCIAWVEKMEMGT